MAKRSFALPGIQDLSKEQEAVRALPKQGQHLVVGGPGTGKSVLALIRARRHHRERDDYLFLVFNHLLNRASGQLFGDGLNSQTWMGWFLDTFQKLTGQPVPRLSAAGPDVAEQAPQFSGFRRAAPAPGGSAPPVAERAPQSGGFRDIDWDGVAGIIAALPAAPAGVDRPFLVIDEGQDMPRQFYDSLIGLGFENFFVVADQNQQIRSAQSSRRDIENGLDIETNQVIELKENFRNNYQVARLAGAFYTGDPASPPPALPKATAGAAPLLYSYQSDDLDKVAVGILRLADRDPRQLIGIIAPNNLVRERYLNALQSVAVHLDNPRPPVETFHGNNRPDVSFAEGGILVINAQACKGLEFDTAILADIDEHYFRPDDPDAAKRLFYVMVARARERVFMFSQRGGGSLIEQILPKDPQVLRREDL